MFLNNEKKKKKKKKKSFWNHFPSRCCKNDFNWKSVAFGDAIQKAGAVKLNKVKKNTASDSIEIERKKGILVATSVLALEYEGINILDTPGNKIFINISFYKILFKSFIN